MIDTIVLRVHNLRKNMKLVNNLVNITSKGYETELGKISQEDMLELLKKYKKAV